MKFINDCKTTNTIIEFTLDQDVTLDEVLEHFQNFLRASGYVIDYNQCLVFEDMDK